MILAPYVHLFRPANCMHQRAFIIFEIRAGAASSRLDRVRITDGFRANVGHFDGAVALVRRGHVDRGRRHGAHEWDGSSRRRRRRRHCGALGGGESSKHDYGIKG